MKSDAIITTIIPTYRRPAMLHRAITSVLSQGIATLKVFVYDNASGDETAEIVAKLQRNDSRISYYCHPNNIGGAANFEHGLSRISTPYFSILSDDDYLLPDFYAQAIDALERHPEVMFWAGITLAVGDDNRIWDARVAKWPREGLFNPPDGLIGMFGGLSPTWTGIVFRRDVLDLVGLPDKDALGASDLDFILKIAANYSFILRKIPVATFTLNATSFSATQPLSAFWPGWQKMLKNLEILPNLSPSVRMQAVANLNADAQRMLLRRAANALADARIDFAYDAAEALSINYKRYGQARLLHSLALFCRHVPGFQWVYQKVYRFVERKIVQSRSALQKQYGHLLRPI